MKVLVLYDYPSSPGRAILMNPYTKSVLVYTFLTLQSFRECLPHIEENISKSNSIHGMSERK
jgi:hypothetical protein